MATTTPAINITIDKSEDSVTLQAQKVRGYGLQVTYRFQGELRSYWLYLKTDENLELQKQSEILVDLLKKNGAKLDDAPIHFDLKNLVLLATNTQQIDNPEIRSQAQKILEIVGKVINPKNYIAYAQQQIPQFDHTRGNIKTRECFPNPSKRVQKLFKLKDRDRIINQFSPVSSDHYYDAWLSERMINALKNKMNEMRNTLKDKSASSYDEKKSINDSIAALDRLNEYLTNLNPFIMNHSTLFNGVSNSDKLKDLKTVLTKNTSDPLNEDEQICLVDLALLSTITITDYVRESRENQLPTACDPNEFPLIRLILNKDVESFFNHPLIKQAINGLDNLRELKDFVSQLMTQADTYKSGLAARNLDFDAYRTALKNTKTAQEIKDSPELFLGCRPVPIH